MKRFIDLRLLSWMRSERRKPLILRGARQVGKTFAVRKLAENFESFIEVNFELQPYLKSIFEFDLEPERIVRDLNTTLNQKIIPGKSLLFLDEIQVVPAAIISLRYFFEKMPQLHIIAAGSLLDFALDEVGMPVGRISALHVYPLSWIEFLEVKGENMLKEAIFSHDTKTPMSEVIHNKALRLLAEYLAIGGMPEAVNTWIHTEDANACLEILQNIITYYKQDFQKYSRKKEIKYVDSVFSNIPHQLGKQFKFSAIPGEFRKRELYPALNLLRKAGVIHNVYHSSGFGIPIGAEANLDKFKVIFLDVALAQSLLGLNIADWFLNPNQTFINKGPLVEAFVGQEILAYSNPILDVDLYYWQRESKSSQAEVDYLIQKEADIIPIEVKSDHETTLRSLRTFLESHPNCPNGIRFSIHNYSFHDKVLSLPLYAVCSLLIPS